MTIGGADLTFQMSFKNNNTYEFLVDRISYTFYLEGQQIEKGLIKGDNNIEGSGEKDFSLQFLLSFFEVGKEMYQVLQQSSASLSIAGEIEVRTAWGRLTIPFNKREDVTISRIS
jgi:LEA14-like dessication related protein